MGAAPSTAQLASLQLASDAVSALSLCGSLLILACYARFSALRKFSFRLVAALALSDVLNHVVDLAGPPPAALEAARAGAPAPPACLAQALGNAEFELASVLWTGAVAATLLAQVSLGWDARRVEALWPRFAAVCWGAPAALALAPLALVGADAYGPSGAWCWIRPQYPALIFCLFYVPLWAVMIFNAAVHARVRARLEGLLAAGSATDAATAARLALILERLKWYPYILLIVWLPASISRVAEAANGGRAIFALQIFQRVFSSSQGLLNAAAYGLSRNVREALAADAARACPGCAAPPAVELDAPPEDAASDLVVARA